MNGFKSEEDDAESGKEHGVTCIWIPVLLREIGLDWFSGSDLNTRKALIQNDLQIRLWGWTFLDLDPVDLWLDLLLVDELLEVKLDLVLVFSSSHEADASDLHILVDDDWTVTRFGDTPGHIEAIRRELDVNRVCSHGKVD